MVKESEPFEVVPFTIVRDSNEGTGFQFTGIKGRSKNGVRLPQIIRITEKAMWAMDRKEWGRQRWGDESLGVGLADYSIEGHEYEIQIERKSIPDLFGTLASRRDNFEREIDRLSIQCRWSCVMIEGGYSHILTYKESGLDPASVVGTITAWSQRYPNVHWIPAGSRDMAERLTFRMLERFWLDREEKIKQDAKSQKSPKTTTSKTEGSTSNGPVIESIEKAEQGNQVGRTEPVGDRSN